MKERSVELDLTAAYQHQLRSMRANLSGAPIPSFDGGTLIWKHIFSLKSHPNAEILLPGDLLPNLNGGVTVDRHFEIEDLIGDLKSRESLHHHLRTHQDKRHIMGIQLFIANWDDISALIHPHAEPFVDPQAFVEVQIGPDIGPIDFVGIASDGSIFLVEFGKGSGKQKQLQGYVDAFSDLFPDHAENTHAFIVHPLHKSSFKKMLLRATALNDSNGGFAASGDRSPQ